MMIKKKKTDFCETLHVTYDTYGRNLAELLCGIYMGK